MKEEGEESAFKTAKSIKHVRYSLQYTQQYSHTKM